MIDGGTLSVNGSIAGSAVTVNAGGTLGGNGTVGNTTVNGGKLAPGNSIGLLTVNGSLSFTAASSYMVEVSPTNADRVNVTGTATLGGATVNLSIASTGSAGVAKQYTIVNAAGGISGTLRRAGEQQPAGRVQVEPELRRQQRLSQFRAVLHRPASTDLNGNQTSVANALINTSTAMAAFRGLRRTDRTGPDASVRPDRHRGAADHGARDDAVHDRDHRCLRRRPPPRPIERDGIRR